MYIETVNRIAEGAVNRANFIKRSITKYMISSMMAGVYVGFGVMLIFSIGAPLSAANSPATKAVMGATFGIALSLVIFAGAELFTGNNLFMTIGNLTKKVTLADTLKVWVCSYIGNLIGALIFAYLIVQSGLVSNAPQSDFIVKVAEGKMNAPFMQLFIRGIFCNMLVCLAIWTSNRAKEDIAKLVLIWWCLFGFIGAGFEHSIANMSLLGMALMLPHDPAVVSVAGYIKNIAASTAGNMVGGIFFIGMMYWYISKE